MGDDLSLQEYLNQETKRLRKDRSRLNESFNKILNQNKENFDNSNNYKESLYLNDKNDKLDNKFFENKKNKRNLDKNISDIAIDDFSNYVDLYPFPKSSQGNFFPHRKQTDSQKLNFKDGSSNSKFSYSSKHIEYF